MSPRRKSGLSPEDLQALKHLPAVIRALENLQEQHAKVRALMGEERPEPQGRPYQGPPNSMWERFEREAEAERKRQAASEDPVPTAIPYQGRNGAGLWECLPGCAMAPGPHEGRVCQRVPLILDTPERREYEAAKKAGKQVPPDLVNISEAQRERMAEQKALVQQLRRAKGLPVVGEAEPVTEEQVVRTEELPTSESGSVGGEEDPEVH